LISVDGMGMSLSSMEFGRYPHENHARFRLTNAMVSQEPIMQFGDCPH
jgi:hypothetical protein